MATVLVHPTIGIPFGSGLSCLVLRMASGIREGSSARMDRLCADHGFVCWLYYHSISDAWFLGRCRATNLPIIGRHIRDMVDSVFALVGAGENSAIASYLAPDWTRWDHLLG